MQRFKRNTIIFNHILFFVLLFCSTNALSQGSIQQNIGIESRTKIGYLIPHRAVMHHLVQGHAYSVEISGVFQTDGSKAWHHTYNFPRIGITASLNTLGNSEVLGNGVGIFPFIELPLVKNDKWVFNSRKGFGLAYISKVFDQQTNQKNNAISTHLNANVTLGIDLSRRFKQSLVTLGLEMTHFSNGANRMPNLGLNYPYFSLGYTRYFKSLEINDSLPPLLPSFSKWSLLMGGFASTRQIYPTGGDNYLITSGGLFLQKQFRPKVKAEIGLEGFYNQSHYAYFSELDPSRNEVIQLGAYAGYLLPLERLEFLVGMGYYYRNQLSPDGPFYHRFGMRYKFSTRWTANLAIKAHWGKADYFEYGIFYSLKK